MSDREARHARLLAGALAWVLAVVAATAVALTAVGAIGDGIIGSGQRPLTPQEVQARLLAATASQAGVGGNGAGPDGAVGAVRPLPFGTPEALPSTGGMVLAQCRGDRVEVVSVTPAQGFQVSDQDEDDWDKVELEAEDITVKLRLSCVEGRPAAREEIDD